MQTSVRYITNAGRIAGPSWKLYFEENIVRFVLYKKAIFFFFFFLTCVCVGGECLRPSLVLLEVRSVSQIENASSFGVVLLSMYVVQDCV